MLEEELAKEAKTKSSKAQVFSRNFNKSEHQESTVEKKQFLKRKTDTAKKSQTSTTKKSYRYYLDNFKDKDDKKKKMEATQESELNTDRVGDQYLIKCSSKHLLSSNKDRRQTLENESGRKIISSDKKNQYLKIINDKSETKENQNDLPRSKSFNEGNKNSARNKPPVVSRMHGSAKKVQYCEVIKEKDEEKDGSPKTPLTGDQCYIYDDSSSIKKVVIKRPYLSKGSGKAGGVGATDLSINTIDRERNTVKHSMNHSPMNEHYMKQIKPNIHRSFDYGQRDSENLEQQVLNEVSINVKKQNILKEDPTNLNLQQKQDYLDRQIKVNEQENLKVVKMKEQYESLLRQVKAEQRELEIKRKKDLQDINKLKEEELLKIKKEKKVLEQRAKNLQFSKQNKCSFASDLSCDISILRKKLNEANDVIRDLNVKVEELSTENYDLRSELQAAYTELKQLNQQQLDSEAYRFADVAIRKPVDKKHQSFKTEDTMSEGASQRPSSRNSNIGRGLYTKEALINHNVQRQISMFDNTKNQSINFSQNESQMSTTHINVPLTTDNDEFENIEKQINKSLGNLNKCLKNSHTASMLHKKHAALSMPFERIEEQAKEESPVKEQRTREEKEFALTHSTLHAKLHEMDDFI